MLDAAGLSALSKLRAQDPTLPIIAVCCGPGVANLSGFARCAGATLTVEQPMDAEALLAAVELALGLQPSADGRLMP
jgi:FixJ family two-component response regulator